MSFDGTIQHWSEKAEHIYGFHRGEIEGQSEQLLIPSTHAAGFEELREKLRLQQSVKFETLRQDKRGTPLPVQLSACVIGTASPPAILVFSSPLAPNEQDNAMEAKLASIIQFSSDAVMSVTAGGIIDSWNTSAEALLGYSAQEIIGRPSSVLFPVDRGWATGMGASELAKGKRLMHDTVRRHKCGHELAVTLVASPLFSAYGVYLGYTVILREADQKKDAIAALRDAEQFNQRILQASKDWISAINPDGAVMFTNEAGRAEIKKQGLDHHRMKWIDLWPSDIDSMCFTQALSGKRVEFASVRKSGDGTTTHWNIALAPIADETGQVLRVVAVARDITADYRHRTHLDLMNKELSHRVKNVLAVISAMVRNSTPGECLELYQDRLTSRIRSLARSHDLLVSTDWTGLDLQDLAASQLASVVGGSVRVTCSGCSLKLKTQAAQMLGIAFHELATNAVKHGALGEAGGHVKLDWSVTETEPGTHSLSINWTETTETPVQLRRTHGFGSQILEDAVAETTNGDATFEVTARGARWSLYVPDINMILAA